MRKPWPGRWRRTTPASSQPTNPRMALAVAAPKAWSPKRLAGVWEGGFRKRLLAAGIRVMATTMGASPVMVVNGPIRERIGMNMKLGAITRSW